ncbi:MAG: hypothetical protein RRY65_03990 [Pseudoflavonifractor sp.]
MLYRIAIIDQDFTARERTHCLAASFFAQRGESAAFVICAGTEELPAYYDCYLRGDAARVSLLRSAEETLPWHSTEKPLETDAFYAMLSAWRELLQSSDGKEGT